MTVSGGSAKTQTPDNEPSKRLCEPHTSKATANDDFGVVLDWRVVTRHALFEGPQLIRQSKPPSNE